MKHKNYFIIILTIVTIGVTACGSLPFVAVQPVVETGIQEQLSAQKTISVTGTISVEEEAAAVSTTIFTNLTYPIVDTDQPYCYDDWSGISCTAEGQAFYGQDAQYTGNTPRYQDNGDGTVTDLVTGLMWQADPGEKMTYVQAAAGAKGFSLAGYTDWRLPTIKELYSLIQFDGRDVSGPNSSILIPFIDTNYFNFEYGDESAGERMIDSQWATSSIYTSSVMNGQQAMFGVNFADGRIKGYGVGTKSGNGGKTFFVIYVRGNTSYGINEFVDNENGTITDNATGLTWTQNDSGDPSTGSGQGAVNWEDALNYCASLDYAGISDWRLPNAKELQSIVDYSRSPDATNSAAIDPIFNISTITNEGGQLDYPAFWSSTTHLKDTGQAGSGVYVTFGRAMGYMNGQWMDVHGAGAQRADQKSGDSSQFEVGRGPQGDAMRVYNYARCVTGGAGSDVQVGGAVDNTPVTQDQPPAGQVPQGQAPNGQAPQGQGPQQQGGPQGQGAGLPPQEAIDACADLNQEDACTVNTPHGTLTGSCLAMLSGQLACVPKSGPPGIGQMPN
jgi:hypothetical protein